ncbi:MAG: hypothetical protein ACREPG_07180 [Candidatus Binatia bacterium]
MPDRSVKRRMIFHIGFEKTGTTSLQNYFTNNDKFLRRNSILYPKRNIGFQNNNHRTLVASYLPRNAEDFFLRPGSFNKARVIGSLMREIEESREDTILISAEHFSSRFRQPQILELASDFTAFNCKIMIFVREHLSRFYSSFATQVASGGQLVLEEYADQVLSPENIYVRYADTITLGEQVFGKNKIDVYLYSDTRNVLEDFFDALLSNGSSLPDPGLYSDKKSLGPNLTEALRLANVVIAGSARPSTYVEWLQQCYVQDRVRKWLERTAGGRPDGHWWLDDHRLEMLNAIAQADRSWLEDRYGVPLESRIQISRQPSLHARSEEPAILLARALVGTVRERLILPNNMGWILPVLLSMGHRLRALRTKLKLWN